MTSYNRAGFAFLVLVLIVGATQVQGAIMPFGHNQQETSLTIRPAPLIVDHMRVPLAVPNFGHATTTNEHVPDLLPISERRYQDRHWGYWLGFSSWNGYSFLLPKESPYRERVWSVPGETASTTPVGPPPGAPEPVSVPVAAPEPTSLILLGLGGAWMVTRSSRRC